MRMTGTIPLHGRRCRHGRRQVVRDGLGSDRLLRESTSERRAHGVVAVGGQEVVEAIDIANPDARTTMRELGQIVQGYTPRGGADAAVDFGLVGNETPVLSGNLT